MKSIIRFDDSKKRRKLVVLRMWSDELVNWLNGRKGKKGYACTVRTLESLQQVASGEREVDSRFLAQVQESGVIPFPEFNSTGLRWRFAWTSRVAQSEPVSYMLRLAEGRFIGRIVQCRQCGKWFVSTRSDAKTHPDGPCRLRYWRTQEREDERKSLEYIGTTNPKEAI